MLMHWSGTICTAGRWNFKFVTVFVAAFNLAAFLVSETQNSFQIFLIIWNQWKTGFKWSKTSVEKPTSRCGNLWVKTCVEITRQVCFFLWMFNKEEKCLYKSRQTMYTVVSPDYWLLCNTAWITQVSEVLF